MCQKPKFDPARAPPPLPPRQRKRPRDFAMLRASDTLQPARGTPRIFAMRIIAAIAVVGLIAAISTNATNARADMKDDCLQGDDRDRQIVDGRLSGPILNPGLPKDLP